MADNDNTIPVFYANQINAFVTQFDMRLRFAQIDGIDDGGKPNIREVVTVYLAPNQVRALTRLLNDRREVYEKIWSAAVPETVDGKAQGQ